MQQTKQDDVSLHIRSYPISGRLDFDFSSLRTDQLTQILDANPTRQFFVSTGIWSAEQSVILATRPYPLKLRLVKKRAQGFAFLDNGTALVDALAYHRQSSFGSLGIECDPDGMPFSRSNLRRLLELENIQELEMSPLKEELACLPFSAKVKTLHYRVDARYIQPERFESLEFVANVLGLTIHLGGAESWECLLVAIFHRIAELGHFDGLTFSIDFNNEGNAARLDCDKLSTVANALGRVIQSNPHLMVLDLRNTHFRFDWGPHFQTIFKAMEEHTGQYLWCMLKQYPSEDPSYSWLEQLLSRNRNIAVFDRYLQKCSNGSNIDKLYALNSFYRASASIAKECTSVRPLLVRTALVRRASGNYQKTALLLSHHTDMLCEFIDGVNLDELTGSQSVPEGSVLPVADASSYRAKRKASAQPSRGE